tara:strand:- start:20 stop:187 length:168 start_codon:yes stop_codon:yes gene_type:complete
MYVNLPLLKIIKIRMIEFLKHLLGLCGEPHPSLLTLLMGSPAVGYILYKLKRNKK